MTFKRIEHIRDILSHIQAELEEGTIRHAVTPDYQVLNYQFTTPDLFDNEWARECRGIKFSNLGWVTARPFHKFFNLNEKETSADIAAGRGWDNVIDVQTKHDGSMIHPMMINGELRLMTRAGLSDQALLAEMTALTYDLETEMKDYISRNMTPIYEFVSPKNRIVVKYEMPELRFLAARHNITGKYEMPRTSARVKDPDAMVNAVRGLRGEEGVVLVWGDGHRIKIKADEYVLLHKTKDMISREINVIRCVLEDTIDDLMGLCEEEDAFALKQYVAEFSVFERALADSVQKYVDENETLSQKEFAIKMMSEVAKPLYGLYFKVRQVGSAVTTTRAFLSNTIRKQKDVNEVWGDLIGTRWEYDGAEVIQEA